ncbi:MAG: ribonuclease Y [Acidobacteriota bacterium]|nr:ribonuclease Y [Acidobacteriota bacterium]
MDPIAIVITVISVLTAIAGIVFGLTRSKSAVQQSDQARDEIQSQLEDQRKQIEAERRELRLQAKEQEIKLKERVEAEAQKNRSELEEAKRRLEDAKKRLDDREDNLDKRKSEIDKRASELDKRQQKLKELEEEAQRLVESRQQELERVAQMTREEARELILSDVEKETRQDCAQLIRRMEEEARREGERRAAEVVAAAIQRCAVDQTTETTVSVVPLPNDEMKGRIIGREGRNIRCFEQFTGIDLIVDDTPEAVVLSGFDPVRREIAKVALESLTSDGRIHPGRIEEAVERARKQTEERMQEAAEAAIMEVGITGLHPEIMRMLGKLRYRTSFGQNVLKHSIEVAHLAGMMASQIGARVNIARRGGLLHDIGKAVDYERDGTHTQIGAEVAKARGESPEIVHCIAAHHDDVEMDSVEAALVQAADAISAARPGARRETLDAYIKRLEGLETIARSFEGVEQAFAIQAGREVRVIVKPERIDDLAALNLAKGMASRIEGELDYPGQIRVTVIRETRAVEYAK